MRTREIASRVFAIVKANNINYNISKEEKEKFFDFVREHKDIPIIEITKWFFTHRYWKPRIKSISDLLRHHKVWFKSRTGPRRPDCQLRDNKKYTWALKTYSEAKKNLGCCHPGKYIHLGNCYIEFIDDDRYEIICVIDEDFEQKITTLINEWKGMRS